MLSPFEVNLQIEEGFHNATYPWLQIFHISKSQCFTVNYVTKCQPSKCETTPTCKEAIRSSSCAWWSRHVGPSAERLMARSDKMAEKAKGDMWVWLCGWDEPKTWPHGHMLFTSKSLAMLNKKYSSGTTWHHDSQGNFVACRNFEHISRVGKGLRSAICGAFLILMVLYLHASLRRKNSCENEKDTVHIGTLYSLNILCGIQGTT